MSTLQYILYFMLYAKYYCIFASKFNILGRKMERKFDFQPKLISALKNYSKEKFMADLMAGIIVGIVALPLAIAFGIASGVRKRIDHRYYRWVHCLFSGRQQCADRGTDGSIYRHRIRYHTEFRYRRTCHCNHYRRYHTGNYGSIKTRHSH